MSSSARLLGEQKLTGLGAQELHALSRALQVLEPQLAERGLLARQQQKTLAAAVFVLHSVITLYGRHITSSTINIPAMAAGGGIRKELIASRKAFASDPEIERSLQQFAQALLANTTFLDISEQEKEISRVASLIRKEVEDLFSGLETLGQKLIEMVLSSLPSLPKWLKPAASDEEESKETLEKLKARKAERKELIHLLRLNVFPPLLDLCRRCISGEASLPAAIIDVLDAGLKVYDRMEQELFTHGVILSMIPEKDLQASSAFRKDLQAELTRWREALAKQTERLQKAVETPARQQQALAKALEEEQKKTLPEAALQVQVTALQAQETRLEKYQVQLASLTAQEAKLPESLQAELPVVAVNWQILTSPDELERMSVEERTFKATIAIDYQPEFQALYLKRLKGIKSASLQEKCVLLLKKCSIQLRQKQTEHKQLLERAQEAAGHFANVVQQALQVEIPNDPGEAFIVLTARTLSCKGYQTSGIENLAASLKTEYPALTNEEGTYLAEQAMAKLNLATVLRTLTQEQEQRRQHLLQQAETALSQYTTQIKETLDQFPSSLVVRQDAGLDVALEEVIAEIARTEAGLVQLDCLEQAATKKLRAELEKFSPVMTPGQTEERIREAIMDLQITERSLRQKTYRTLLQERAYVLKMQILTKNGDTQTLAKGYKETACEIVVLAQKVEGLQGSIKAAEAKILTLTQDQEKHDIVITGLGRQLVEFHQQEENGAEELDWLSQRQAERSLETKKAEHDFENAGKEIYELHALIPPVSRKLQDLSTQLCICEEQLVQLKRHDQDFFSNSAEEEAKLNKKKEILLAEKAQIIKELNRLTQRRSELSKGRGALRAQLESSRSMTSQEDKRIAELQQNQSQLKISIASQLKLIARAECSAYLRRSALQVQQVNKAQHNSLLQATCSGKALLEKRNQQLSGELCTLLKQQFQVHVERLREFSIEVNSSLAALQASEHKVMRAKSKTDLALSGQLPAQLATLASEKMFVQVQTAQRQAKVLQKTLQEIQDACNKLLADTEGVISPGSELDDSVKAYLAASSCFKKFKKALLQVSQVSNGVLNLMETALIGELCESKEKDRGLRTALQSIATRQKDWQNTLNQSAQHLTTVQEEKTAGLESLESKASDVAPSLEQMSEPVAKILRAASALQTAATAEIPRLTTDPWHLGLESLTNSLAEIETQGGTEANEFVAAARKKIEETDKERAGLIEQERSLFEQGQQNQKRAQDAALLVLKSFQTACGVHQRRLELVANIFADHQGALRDARVKLDESAAPTRHHDVRLQAATQMILFPASLESPYFILWAEAQLNKLEAILTAAQSLQPELTVTLQQEISSLRELQKTVSAAHSQLQQTKAEQNSHASAVQTQASFDKNIAELVYYQKRLGKWLEASENKRALEQVWWDRLELVASCALYVLTCTLWEIKTEKAQVHQAIQEVNTSFAGYVAAATRSSEEKQQETFHATLMTTLNRNLGLFSAPPAQNQPPSTLRSCSFFPTTTTHFFPHLKLAKEVAEEFSPKKIHTLRRGGSEVRSTS